MEVEMRRGVAAGIVGGLALVWLLMASGSGGRPAKVEAAAKQMQQPAGQTQQPTGQPPHGVLSEPAVDENDPSQAKVRQEMIVRQNDARHKRLAEDADRLLALSTELKADVDKTPKDELSLEVVRKAAEIEKLAHDVRQRMQQ